MSEDHLNPENVLKAFIESRYGSNVYEKYASALGSGELASVEDAVAFLDKNARNIEGKLLTKPQLECHDEKVLAEIRRILQEKKGLHIAKFQERRLLSIAEHIGYAVPPAYTTTKESGKRLTQSYIDGLVKYIKDNFAQGAGSAAEAKAKAAELQAKNTLLEGQVSGMTSENEKLHADIEKLQKEYSEVLKGADTLRDLVKKYEHAVFTDIQESMNKKEEIQNGRIPRHTKGSKRA